MSRTERVSSRSEIQVNIRPQNRFRTFIERFFLLCNCFKKQENNVSPSSVHAVDSVRLVYMRRIEEASLLNIGSPEDYRVNERAQLRMRRYKRGRQELTSIKALEKALKEYESRHKTIISSTRVPEVVSFDKAYKISRTSQTETKEVWEELFKTMKELKMRNSIRDKEIKHVMLNSTTEITGIQSNECKKLAELSSGNYQELLDNSSKITLQTV